MKMDKVKKVQNRVYGERSRWKCNVCGRLEETADCGFIEYDPLTRPHTAKVCLHCLKVKKQDVVMLKPTAYENGEIKPFRYHVNISLQYPDFETFARLVSEYKLTVTRHNKEKKTCVVSTQVIEALHGLKYLFKAVENQTRVTRYFVEVDCYKGKQRNTDLECLIKENNIFGIKKITDTENGLQVTTAGVRGWEVLNMCKEVSENMCKEKPTKTETLYKRYLLGKAPCQNPLRNQSQK